MAAAQTSLTPAANPSWLDPSSSSAVAAAEAASRSWALALGSHTDFLAVKEAVSSSAEEEKKEEEAAAEAASTESTQSLQGSCKIHGFDGGG